MRSFDPPTAFTGHPGDWFILAVFIGAALLAPLFLVVRNRHPEGVYSPPVAWLRALLYFSVVLVASWATGVFSALWREPCVAPGQSGDSIWLALTGLWLLVTAWAYVYWWPRGTLIHNRKSYLIAQTGFGLLWGFCSGQLTLVFWALLEDFGPARWLTAVGVFVVLSGYGQVYQSGWWDIHVSPPHNRRDTNAGKVLFGHMPFLLVGLAHFTLFGNALVFVGFHMIALGCSAVAMRFPPFWEADGPVVNRETAIGV
jgi:hypothetical protein